MPSRTAPGPDQESVWDYPRPPRLERTDRHLQVIFDGVLLADTTAAYRVLETSHPPTYYLPPDDIAMEHLQQTGQRTLCEFKGQAVYYDVAVGEARAEAAAWAYPNPRPRFQDIAGYVSFYAHRMDRCVVDGEDVAPQEGSFYGGWITSDVVGPFKGGPGTRGW
ncbi:DUF427 domain-containing protein [Salisaeta longa]|uniref:DUF427 domain-containing protein n=1 Tax=Salisaeta longa TaxID=503170 RepID=UPI0003B5F480|nr:DUF427 domain-containing protein [Salisaeta longa]